MHTQHLLRSAVLIVLVMVCTTLSLAGHAAAQDDQPASISGRVFVDTNGDGVDDPDEPGVSQSAIVLFLDGEYVSQSSPNSSGRFRFDGLAPGSYTIQFALAGFGPFVWIPDADDPPNMPGMRITAPFELAANEELIINGGAAEAARIEGTVFLDLNSDDRGGPGDQNITGLPVRIRDVDDNVVWEGTTNAYGWYAHNVDAGSYVVEFETADDLVFVRKGDNRVAVVSDVDPSTGRSDLTAFSNGTHRRVDAGLRAEQAPSIALAQIVDGPIDVVGDQLTVRLRYVLANIGTVDLVDVTLVDRLASAFEGATVLSVEPTGGCAESAIAGTLSLIAQQSCTATVEAVVTGFAPSTTYASSARVFATGPDGGTDFDLSDDGDVIDPDGDGEANEEGENDPTPILVPFPDGDVDCNGFTDIVDALQIVRFEVRAITAADQCPTNTDQLFARQGDVNGDGSTDVIDALYIAQCDAFVDNPYCERMNIRP